MSEPPPQRLLAWALAAFHNGFFFAATFALLYRSGRLADLLGSLNTLLGIAVFAALWALTWWTTRRALAGVDWLALERPRQLLPIAGRGLLWGGVNGLLFFLAALLVGGVSALVLASLQPSNASEALTILPGLIFVGAAGSIVSFGLGAAVGLALGLTDLVIVLMAQAITSRAMGS